MMNFLKALLPPCNHCGIPAFSFLCDKCFEDLKFSHACRSCGQFPIHQSLEECLPCTRLTYPWNKLSVAFKYEGGVRELILDFKDRNKPERIREIEFSKLPPIRPSDYDFIVYAAADPLRTRQRIYDPTYLLSKRLGELWGIPLFEDIFERKVFLSSQKELDRETRKKYLKNILSLAPLANELKSKRLLFVDDVMTTGATLEVHLKLLHEVTDKVDVFCLARALKV